MIGVGFLARLVYGARRLVHRADWLASLGRDYADRIMKVAVTDRFHTKQGRSTGRWLVGGTPPPLRVYLKRHRRLPWRQRLLATLWPYGDWSPAMAERSHLLWAKEQGIPVPAPLAAGEFIGPWLRLESFIAIEELTGMIPLNEAIPRARQQLTPLAFRAWKRGCLAEAARLTRLLHQAHRFHKDLYLCHFFVRPALAEQTPPGPGDVFLIDLHRLGHHRWTGWYWRIKDLAQLLYSSALAGLDDRDRLRFFRRYLGGRLDRRLLAAVRAKAERYRQHNERRPQRSLAARAVTDRRTRITKAP